MWANVVSLISGPSLWLLVKTFSQNWTRHFIENIMKFFDDLERWPSSYPTIVAAFWQMLMAPLSIVLRTILCSFKTCRSRQGVHHCFTLVFWPIFQFCNDFLNSGSLNFLVWFDDLENHDESSRSEITSPFIRLVRRETMWLARLKLAGVGGGCSTWG